MGRKGVREWGARGERVGRKGEVGVCESGVGFKGGEWV